MELRWDPVLGEWVMVSSIREERPWHPDVSCPFCPGAEETGYGWDVLLLENKYPMLSLASPKPSGHWFYRVERAIGRCFILVETPQHDLDDLSDLDRDHILRVLEKITWLERKYVDVEWARYFMWFRNKGKEIGVSLTHPHSQIYILPFIPSKVERELANAREYYRENRVCLFCKILDVEEKDKTRIVYRNNSWTAFIPFYAHWPYEVHLYPRNHIQYMHMLSHSELIDLADALKKVLCGLKRIYSKPMPYMLILHQAPYRGDYGYYHLHIEIYGVYRGDGLLKYAAGMESGGGNFTYDGVPEDRALLLRRTIIERCR